LSGITVDGFELVETSIDITKYEISSSHSYFEATVGRAELRKTNMMATTASLDIYLYISNLVFAGASKFTANIAGERTEFRAHSEGKISFVAEATSISPAEIEMLENNLDIVCRLLSVATGHRAEIMRVEAWYAGKIVYVDLWRVQPIIASGHALTLYSRSVGSEIAEYIDYRFSAYRRTEQVFPLYNLSNILLQVGQVPFIETKILLLSNFLEVIRFSNASKIGAAKGYMSQQGDRFYWTDKQKGRGALSFETILADFFSYNRITGWDNDFKLLRNEIVHTGAIKGSPSDVFQRYLAFHHFCSRLFLGLLDWDQASGYYIPITEPVTQGRLPRNNWKRFIR
jgi:hypothetical protein